jgi:hypothetical protein
VVSPVADTTAAYGASGPTPYSSPAEVIVRYDRVSFIVNDREFEVVVAPTLVDALGAPDAAVATAETLRYALGANVCVADEHGPCSCGGCVL